MCGILALYQEGGLRNEDLARAQKALDSMSHRGPDGAGIHLVNTQTGQSWSLQLADSPSDLEYDLNPENYSSGQADLLLAHRRLSIFDLSSAGHQPMADAGGNLIVFNGEVYNFPELREELKSAGHSFTTGTDTEVILAAYRHWGTDCINRFNGMWTFVLFDKDNRQVVVSNDRAGIKQLYLYEEQEAWMCASEIKALRSYFPGRMHLNAELAGFFLQNGVLDVNSETLFKEVNRVPPGTVARTKAKELSLNKFQPYWNFPTGTQKFRSMDEAAAKLRYLLDDAIRLRMRSDVPWGTTLSGGLDSSSIVYIANALRQESGQKDPIRTFTAIFPGQEGDESQFAKSIEKDLGTLATYSQPLNRFSFEDFERFMCHQDQPVASTSMYAQWAVMEIVGQSPVKVLLDGQGGDELFAGYHHHVYKLGRDLLLKGKFAACNRLVREFCALKGRNEQEVQQIIRNDAKLFLKLKLGGKMPGPKANRDWNAARSLRDVLRQDLQSWVMPMLLRYEDRNSMAFSIEARLPFLDYRIIEFAFQLPDEYKIRNGWQKAILREAVPELPESIRYRKDKKGFTTPEKDWVNQYKDRFLHHAQAAVEAGVPVPWSQPLSELPEKFLFRLSNVGLWLSLD